MKGTHYEMGLQLGRQCKKEILHLLTFYLYGAVSLTPGFRTGHPKLSLMLPVFFTYKQKKGILRSKTTDYEAFIKNIDLR